jgi:hypothetical protein
MKVDVERAVPRPQALVRESRSIGPANDTPVFVAGLSDIRLIGHDEPTAQRFERNHGAGVATTARLAFCDDDGRWAPTPLRSQRRGTPFRSF